MPREVGVDVVERQALRQQHLDPADDRVGALEAKGGRVGGGPDAGRHLVVGQSAGRVTQDRDDVGDRLGRRVAAHRRRDRQQRRRRGRCRATELAPYVTPFCSRSTVLIRDEKLPPTAIVGDEHAPASGRRRG